MQVLGKHSRGGKREEAYGMFGAVSAFKAMHDARRDAKPDDLLFTENHRDGIKELLIKADLRCDADGHTRDAKSLRQTGISLRLDLGPNPDYRDIGKWARTSPAKLSTIRPTRSTASNASSVSGNVRRHRKRKKAARSNQNEGPERALVLFFAAGKQRDPESRPGGALRMAPSFSRVSGGTCRRCSRFRLAPRGESDRALLSKNNNKKNDWSRI